MAARHVERQTITTADELDDLELAMAGSHFETVILDVPDGSEALTTSQEFRRVLRAARAAGVAVRLDTADPLRRELARIVGFPLAADGVLDRPVVRASDASSETFRIVAPPSEQATARQRTQPRGDDAPTSPPCSSFETTTRTVAPPSTPQCGCGAADDDEDDEPSYSFVIHPPLTRSAVAQPAERLRATTTIPAFDLWQRREADDAPQYAPPRHRKARVIALTVVALTVVVLGALLAMVVVPSAVIAVAPVDSTIATRVTYGVALPGTNWDIAVPPQTVTAPLTFTATAPATGERFEPDAPARGLVLLTNASTTDVFVPAGTIVGGGELPEYATVADIAVPAADPFGTLTIGSAVAEVVAVAPGPESNIAAEVVTGQLESGVYYLNREPLEGGTLRRVATVTQADIDRLRNQATAALDAQADSAIAERLAPEQWLLPDTERRTEVTARFDRRVGDDGDTVTIEASLTVTAQTYTLGDIHDRARVEALDRLQALAGSDVTVLAGTVHAGEPEPIAGSGGLAFMIDAEATVRTIIDEGELATLRSELAGSDQEDALARIQRVRGVGAVAIERAPDWLGDRLPRLGSRIEIEVVDATRISAQTAPAGP